MSVWVAMARFGMQERDSDRAMGGVIIVIYFRSSGVGGRQGKVAFGSKMSPSSESE